MSQPYRKGLSLEALVDELRRNRGTQFDPTLTDLFVDALLAPSSPLKAAASGPESIAAA
jgi:HD-GYP domain-containing protein (c-di-GMP phosphodiesterase class II)